MADSDGGGASAPMLDAELQEQVQATFVSTLQSSLDDDSNLAPVVIQFEVGDRHWHIDTRNASTPLVSATRHPQPDATLRCSFETLRAISRGKLKVPMAILRGRIKLDGSRPVVSGYGRHLRRAFQACKPIVNGQRPPQPQARRGPQEQQSGSAATPPLQGLIAFDRTGFRMEQYLAKKWVPDDERDACVDCQQAFSLFRRRHHCRVCGEVFCGDCSNFYIMDYRVCGACQQKVLEAQRTFHTLVNDTPSHTPPRSRSATTPHRASRTSGDAAATRPAATASSSSSALSGETVTAHLEREAARPPSSPGSKPLRHGSSSATARDQPTAGGQHRRHHRSSSRRWSRARSRGRSNSSGRGTGEKAPATGLLEGRLSSRIRAMEVVPVEAAPVEDTGAATRKHIESELQTEQGDGHAQEQHRRAWSWFPLWSLLVGITAGIAAAFAFDLTPLSLTAQGLPSQQQLVNATQHHAAVTSAAIRASGPFQLVMHHPLVLAATTVAILVLYVANRRTLSLMDRRLRVYYTATLVIARILFLKYWSKRFPLGHEQEEERWNRLHRNNARRVQLLARRLRGFWVKVGQYLSSRGDVMPEPWVRELRSLQDTMPFQSFQDVKKIVEEELERPLEDLFSSFEEVPIASASIAQVHVATLKRSREKVVVKVQHKNIGRIMRQDLKDLMVIVTWVAYFEPEYDFKPVLEEWAKVAIRELDFKNEAANMQRVRNNLLKTHLDVIVPKLEEGLFSDRVIVMEYCEGFKVTDTDLLDAHGINRESLMRRICQAYAHQVYIDGFFNCDPHPGNILVQVRQGKVYPVLLDYGMCRELPHDKKRAFAAMIYSATTLDFGTLLWSFEAMGLKLKRDDPLEDMKNIRFVLRDTAPGAEMRRDFKKFREDVWQKRQQLPRSERNPVEAWPPELLFFFRVTLLLRGLCAVLGVRLRYSLVLAPYAHLALLQSYDRSLHATQPVTAALPDPSASAAAATTCREHYGASGMMRRQWSRPTSTGDDDDAGAGAGAGAGVEDDTAALALAEAIGPERVLVPDAGDAQRAALAVLRELYDEGLITGMQVAVYHGGQCVVNACAGTMGAADPRPVRPDTLFNCFSVMKGVTATALHMLADQNLLGYEDEVGRHWPQYACNGKERTSIRHVLTHRAGLQRFPGSNANLNKMCQWNTMLKEVEAAEAETRPGDVARYHVLSFGWIIGGIIERVTRGQPFPEFLRQRVAVPLGIADEFMIGLDMDDASIVSRLATLCNGFFASDDGEPPTEEDVKRLLAQLRQADLPQQRHTATHDEGDVALVNGVTAEGRRVPAVAATAQHGRGRKGAARQGGADEGDGAALSTQGQDGDKQATREEAQGGKEIEEAGDEGDEEEKEEKEEEGEEEEEEEPPRHPDAWPPVLNSVPHRYDDLVADTRAEVLKEMDNRGDGWALVKTASDVEIWKKKIPNSPLVMVRGEGDVGRHPAVIFKILTDASQKPRWNKDFACLDDIEVFDDCTKVIRDEYKPIWPVAGRDMCFVQSLQLRSDGGFVMSSRSVEHPQCPPKPPCVRAEGLGGFRVAPYPDNPNKCRVTYLTAIDPKGRVPSMVVNVVATNQPLSVDAVRKLAMSMPQYTPPPEPESKPAAATAKKNKKSKKGKRAKGQKGEEKQGRTASANALKQMDVRNGRTSSQQAARSVQQQQQQQQEEEEEEEQAEEEGPASGSDVQRLDPNKFALMDPCIYNTTKVRKAVIPSANGHFSARALAKFYALLANNGRLGSLQLLRPETVEMMSQTQPMESSFIQGMRIRWGLGFQKYRLKRDGKVLDTPFGHLGLGGSAAFCDPHTNTSVAVTVNRLQLDKEVAERVVDAISDALRIGQFDLL